MEHKLSGDEAGRACLEALFRLTCLHCGSRDIRAFKATVEAPGLGPHPLVVSNLRHCTSCGHEWREAPSPQPPEGKK